MRPLPLLAIALLPVASACGDGPPPEADFAEGEVVRLEGRIVEIDATPMFVDGDGRIRLDTEAHGAVMVRVPARERRCQARGLDLFTSLETGDSLRAVGRVTGAGEVTVCADSSHLLARLG